MLATCWDTLKAWDQADAGDGIDTWDTRKVMELITAAGDANLQALLGQRGLEG